ncbi:MAG: hypothetical protein DI589_12840 [Shinella sp.]|nr:MAG: hypothetical protein DI589_12840 [Shinella sp.]
MSTVRKAYDIQACRFVAIKQMKNVSSSDLRWKESFNREYSALSDLSLHQNIVELYDAGVDEGGNYIVLEWAETNLSEYISKVGGLTWDEYYQKIGRPLLEALSFAQSRGWTHRDIKPQNILIADGGVPKIADYGIAKQFDKPSLGLTFSGFRSAPFTPPEDDSQQYSCSRDCFSWVAVSVYCLTGRIPADYGAQEAALRDLSADLVPTDILLAALSNDPSERPPLASALLADIDAWSSQHVSSSASAQTVHVGMDPTLSGRLRRLLSQNDDDLVRREILEELNEISVGVKLDDQHLGARTRLRIFAVSWVFEGVVDDKKRDILILDKAWPFRPQEVERRRENSFRAGCRFTFDPPAASPDAEKAIDELLLGVEAFEAEERDRAIVAQQDRIFRLWYAFLRAKADLEGRRENAINFIDRRVDENKVVFVTELPASFEVVGQSRVVKQTSGSHIFCDVVDVNLEEITVSVTSGNASRLPKQGALELNTIAAEKAIERQRYALDAVNFNRSPNPRLRTLLADPSTSREPTLIDPPKRIEGGPFDSEKLDILKRALGVQDVLAIQGPPGTGKTRLIEEILVQYLALHPDHRVLLSAQTHVALDNVIERLRVRQSTINIVRIGRVDDPKIGTASRDLILDRKAQAWADGVIASSSKFLTQWAVERGIDRTNTEVGMLAERLILLMQRRTDLRERLNEANARLKTVNDQAEAKLTETGSAESAELSESSVEAQQIATALRVASDRVRVEIEEVRARLSSLGEFGKELSSQEEEDELREWCNALLGETDGSAQFRDLLELHEEWVLRVGRSSDFHAAMLASAQVVAGTCVGMAGVKGMAEVAYDLCIIDEASKATATELLVPMSRSRKWILVGDPEQLPPFFEDESVTQLEEFQEEEVRETLLDRFLSRLPSQSVARLANQHRMVKPIGDLISYAFYDGNLVSPKTKPDVVLTGSFPKPVTWLSTSHIADKGESRVGKSFKNDTEARLVRDALERINFIAKKRKVIYSVALIAGYVAQVKALQDVIRDRLHEWTNIDVTCSTVDAFQGSEAEFCIYSVTRSNKAGQLGFLREKPRLNVALSRGRSALIIVGDEDFCRAADGKNPFRSVIDFIERHADDCERRQLN